MATRVPVDGFPPPATVLMVKLCPTQTLRNKKRPQAIFVISIRHVSICGKMAEHHYRRGMFFNTHKANSIFILARIVASGYNRMTESLLFAHVRFLRQPMYMFPAHQRLCLPTILPHLHAKAGRCQAKTGSMARLLLLICHCSLSENIGASPRALSGPRAASR